jgi:hypothetical protein
MLAYAIRRVCILHDTIFFEAEQEVRARPGSSASQSDGLFERGKDSIKTYVKIRKADGRPGRQRSLMTAPCYSRLVLV